jgi:predicted transcriptional regulator
MPLHGAKHTTMTDTMSIALCKHRKEYPKLMQKELIIWLQQDEDLQDFIRSLQQMKNKINKIHVNQMVQLDIRKFFNRW